MSNLFLTLVIAFVILVIAIAGLAIGWLITGKTKIEKKACGVNSKQKHDETSEITTSCSVCIPSSPNEKNTPHKKIEGEEKN